MTGQQRVLLQALVAAWECKEVSFWDLVKSLVECEEDTDSNVDLPGVYGGQVVMPKHVSDAEIYGALQRTVYKGMEKKEKNPTKPVGSEVEK